MKLKIIVALSILISLLLITPSDAKAVNTCNGACTTNVDCASDYVCLGTVCRGACNPSDAACGCVGTATTAPSSTASSTPIPTPVTGNSLPTTIVLTIGVILILGSFLFVM